MSVLDFTSIGSSMSVRGVARFGNEAYIHGKLKFADDTYLESISGAIQAVVVNQRALSLSDSGGVLHGTWMADTVVAVSDRRLKDNIKPLVSTLQQNYDALHARPSPGGAPKPAAPVAPGDGGGGRDEQAAPKKDSPALSWVLRQLRPVSYNFRKGSEAKNMRFGFIADEMERVLPQVVRELPAEASGPGPQGDRVPGPHRRAHRDDAGLQLADEGDAGARALRGAGVGPARRGGPNELQRHGWGGGRVPVGHSHPCAGARRLKSRTSGLFLHTSLAHQGL
eukprot:CAMPEP_0179212714 /NCGR_PEP_ID=MMETSP0797-20121207/1260_1 /TAXON_ID=47934 /ORGANISM="Dinophysis acuminata, Strain DAEP01" /LENGTH=280 /DNA_ID=CAMNT_0020918359 /DNA_START=130 /DNA_END=972 /DNA_ORIENTATION=-